MGLIFKKGKYKGKKAEWVKMVDPQYYRWALTNAVNIIVDDSIPKYEQEFRYSPMKPNENFLNEGPWEPPY